MTVPERQKEAFVCGDILVRPGDKVVLLPSSSDFLKNWLGEGPFTISWIGKWPCGKVMLYLKGAKSDEPGVFTSYFKCAS